MNITTFSDTQLAGQRLMVGFDGTEFNNDLIFLIDRLKIGGIILFSRNITGPQQIRDLCSSVQKFAASCGQPPLFIAIDQEGGKVARLKEPFTQFAGNSEMKDINDAVSFARITAEELTRIGVNMNMAPVLDIAPIGVKSVMAKRSFGHDPSKVSRFGAAVIEHLQQNGIMSVAKHFPGIGRTTLDSHYDIPSLDIDLTTLESSDLLPFNAAVEHDVSGVMLSHILYNRIDPVWPASLSSVIAKDLLRRQIGFEGLVITDDIDMGAVKRHYDIKTIVKQVLSADIDIILICHKSPDIEKAYEEMLINTKKLDRKTTEESVKRILKYKEKFIVN